jgi:hypothetical protein
MGRNKKSRIAAAVGIVFLVAAGCGSDGGPQDALDDFADAINDRDEDAALALTCKASHEDISATMSDPFKNNPTGVDVYAVEPRLRDMHWDADAGDIVEETGTEATGKVEITVEGVPEDLPPEAQQAMDSVQIAFPLTLVNPKDDTVKLVKEGDAWVVCD